MPASSTCRFPSLFRIVNYALYNPDKVLYGTGGDDTLPVPGETTGCTGSTATTTLRGGDGDDRLYGGWGQDNLYGDNGN